MRWWFLVFALVQSAGLCFGAWPDGEQRVAAYYFNEEVFDVSKLKSPAVQRAARPLVSRFLGEGDVLWDLTPQFREGKVVSEQGKVIVNATRSRFVVKGSQDDHLRFETLWRNYHFWHRPSVEFELLRVPSKEARLVPWNDEELKKRKAKPFYQMEERFSYRRRNTTRDWEDDQSVGSLSFRMHASQGSAEVIMAFSVAIPSAVEIISSLSFQVRDRIPAVVELGALNAREVIVLKATVTERYRDRTAVADGIVFEHPKHQVPVYAEEVLFGCEYLRSLGGKRNYQMVFSPLFFENRGQAEDSDPFETSLASFDIDWRGVPVAFSTKEVPGFARPFVIYDVREELSGIVSESPDNDENTSLPKESFFWQEGKGGVMTAVVNPQIGSEIVDLVAGLGQAPVEWRRPCVVSLLEWEGDRESSELVPKGFRRIAKVGVVLRSNQIKSMTHRRSEGEDQLEAELIAGMEGHQLRLAVDFAEGDRLTTLIKVEETEVRLIPLGRVGGKNRGILLEMKKVKLDGTDWPRLR